ncbi:hypothetical protein VTJ49DRAFT_2551 [Mycothermus thermophilus]|uniref:ABC transporter domain-containing protein n=1 Tax=Humicola insolens TaxID=85995 RepID=A0ABR3VP52_HUMIN
MDLEASGSRSPGPHISTDLWAGFQQALDAPPHVYNDVDGVITSIRKTAESSLSPEIRAFVESMRRATDVTDFGLSFGYKDLSCHPKGSREPILSHISGSIRRGALTAIMGGSGAGKTTFVNVLMGKAECTHGEIQINGVPDKLKRYKKLVGYVPQDDIVLPDMTVYENIHHSARIRLPREWGDNDVRAHVESVINCLELAHIKDSMVGSIGKPTISGGQRKRVSIGMELAAAPMAIFLDEPTSGLDATAASSIMRTLKAIARLGISVVVIIHQPRVEIFDMIDDLILLANGQQLYEGPEANVRPFFERLGYTFPKHANLGDVVTDIITGNGRAYKQEGDISKDGLVAHWRTSRYAAASGNEGGDIAGDGDALASGTSTAVPSRAPSPPPPALETIMSARLDSLESGADGPRTHEMAKGSSGTSSTNRRTRSEVPDVRPDSPSRSRSRSRFRDRTLSIASVRESVRESVPVFFPQPVNPQRAIMLQYLKKRGASRLKQMRLCLSRALLQQSRDFPTLFFELGLAALAGSLLGLAENPKAGVLFLAPYYPPYDVLSVSMDVKSAPEMALLTAIAIGLVSSAPGVRFFSEEMLVQRREAEAGHSRLAYFVAKNVSVLPRMMLACLHFTTPLFLLSVPIIPWWVAFATNLFYFYCIYGLASCVSMVAKRESAPLLATMTSLIIGILSGGAPSLNSVKTWHLEWLWRMSPGVWLAEIYFGQLVNPLRHIYDVHLASRLVGFDLEGTGRNLGVLVAIGTIYRIIAFVGLVKAKKMRV